VPLREAPTTTFRPEVQDRPLSEVTARQLLTNKAAVAGISPHRTTSVAKASTLEWRS
jgi:hypothetical protein